MKRLFALGCSFTSYAWPSYADFAGLYFDEYENWAFPGLGNRALLERLLYNGLILLETTLINLVKVTGEQKVVFLIL
jgi:hypothetical protein